MPATITTNSANTHTHAKKHHSKKARIVRRRGRGSLESDDEIERELAELAKEAKAQLERETSELKVNLDKIPSVPSETTIARNEVEKGYREPQSVAV